MNKTKIPATVESVISKMNTVNKLYSVLESYKYCEKTEQGRGEEECCAGGGREQLSEWRREVKAAFAGNRTCEQYLNAMRESGGHRGKQHLRRKEQLVQKV